MTEIDEDDPYAVSSDSDTESHKGPPPKINIEERTVADISSLKEALKEKKEKVIDENRLEELNQLKSNTEISKIKKDFIEGKVQYEVENTHKSSNEEREQLAAVTKEKYSKFKEKFEKLPEILEQSLENKLKSMEKEHAGVGKENLENIREAFEKPQSTADIDREQIVIERSELDKERIMKTFVKPDITADEAPKECAVCSKIVYPVERIFVNKQNYHSQCFNCSKCSKKLSATNYNMYEGNLLCKVHYLEIFHPEIAKTMDPSTTEEDERFEVDEEEYAISSKPKLLGDDVVKSGAKVDDLSTIGSLKARKGDWESSAKESVTPSADRKNIAENEIQSGKVKLNLERFLMGTVNDQSDDEYDNNDFDNNDYNDDDDNQGRRRHPHSNIVRENRKNRLKENVKFDHQVDELKSKWQSGNIQGGDSNEISKEELEELRKGPGLKERFRERTDVDESIVKQWDQSELDTSGAADARRSFLEGSAFQSGPIEKTAVELSDLDFKKLQAFKERFEKGDSEIQFTKTPIDIHTDLGDLKENFEKGVAETEMTPEERAEIKKKEIEQEFLRYKAARRAAAQREAIEKANSSDVVQGNGAEVVTIKDRFEKGDVFRNQQEEKPLDVEIKMAGKAREKFRQIDAEGAQELAFDRTKEKQASKWDKKNGAVPEPINRREVVDEGEEPEDEDAYDVKNLMNKFKNIGNEDTSKLKHEKPVDLQDIKLEAKSLKEQFERAGINDDREIADEKRKQLEEEFERLRREKEEAAAAHEQTPEDDLQPQKEEVHVIADHATKMTAKWEKIQKKEAKKAERSKMVQKVNVQNDK